jgi:hypothetical protein
VAWSWARLKPAALNRAQQREGTGNEGTCLIDLWPFLIIFVHEKNGKIFALNI